MTYSLLHDSNTYSQEKKKMPILTELHGDPLVDGRQSEAAMNIRRGVIKGFKHKDICFLAELSLSNGRRADLIGLTRKGEIIIVEIKSSTEDFKVDQKWHEYKEFCDQFYFATSPEVPAEIFPQDEGFIVADQYGCEILREANLLKLPAATRKALTLRFARSGAERLRPIILQE